MTSGFALLVVATPDSASSATNGTVTGDGREPKSSAAGEAAPKVSVGATVSRLIVTDLLVMPPVDVAVQVNVTPAVSVVTALVPQPLTTTGESVSVTFHETCTLLRYQPSFPAVPVTVGVTTG